MKRFILLVWVFTTGYFGLQAQTDTALLRRLDDILRFTQFMDMEKIMEYTYPKLFTIATREQLIEVIKSSLDNEEFSTTLDSLKADTVFPVFSILDESFSKIRHSMIMRMKFKESLDSNGNLKDRGMMTNLMRGQFGKDNVRYDQKSDAIVTLMHPYLLAIKNKEDNTWYFVNLDEENIMMMDVLFSKEVQDKLKEYK